MGFIGDWLRSKNMKDPVAGTLQVTASTYPPDSATSANFSLNGVVSADGLPPTAVEHAGIARTRKWPHAGQRLPVVVDRADPTRIDIQWDEVPDSWDSARQGAQALADQLRGAGGDAQAQTFTFGASQTIDATGIPGLREEILKLATAGGSPDQIMAALREHGVDVPDGATFDLVDTQGEASGGVPSSDEDPASRLRKLDELRAQGLIDEQEHAAQRARILGDI